MDLRFFGDARREEEEEREEEVDIERELEEDLGEPDEPLVGDDISWCW